MLPLELPEVDDFSPKTFEAGDVTSAPEPPLARADRLGERHPGPGRRPAAVPPRDQHHAAVGRLVLVLPAVPVADDDDRFVDAAAEKYWMGPRDAEDTGGVDLYVGGAEHAVLHLLYARFWHKVLFDLGHVTSAEPFRKLFNQGMIQGASYTDARERLRPGRPRSRSATARSSTRASRSPSTSARSASR